MAGRRALHHRHGELDPDPDRATTWAQLICTIDQEAGNVDVAIASKAARNFELTLPFADSRKRARLIISAIATTRRTTGPITTWRSTWRGMRRHAPASCHYEVGSSSPDTSTFYSTWTKSSDIWTSTIGSIETRLSLLTTTSSSLSRWVNSRSRLDMCQTSSTI